MYIPVLILTSLFLTIFKKENKLYQRSRLLIFFIGITLIILSETLLRFVKEDFYYNFKIIFIPIILFIILYISFNFLLKKNIGART